MTDKPAFSVSVVGLDPQHLRLIAIVFRHIQYNRFVFRLARPEDAARADILIAAVGDPAGREALARARSGGTAGAGRASIAVVGPHDRATTRHALEIGQLVRQLLPILNRVVELEGLAGGPRRLRTGPASTDDAEHRDGSSSGARIASRPRVLVIDDSVSVQRHLVGAFCSMGLDVDTATSGGEALQRLAAHPVDLAMLDIVLPDTDGLQLARAIRREPRWRALPIVVLSSRRSAIDVMRGAAAGCSAYLAKPVDIAVLRRTVARQLGRVRAPDTLPPQLRPVAVPAR